MSYANNKIMSVLYFITIVWGVSLFWISPHLPLVDFPQHAAQASLLRDLLFNQSKWADIVTINYFTPNLTIYGVVILLMTFFKVNTAFSIALSTAYCLFIYFSIQLRKHFKADYRLDWLFLLPFFGYAYNWGLVTYVMSAPLAFWFILLADKYALNPTRLSAVGLIAVGLLLLEAHGLMFLFTIGVGGLILIQRVKTIKSFMLSLIPYISLLVVFGILYKFNGDFNRQLGATQYVLSSITAIEWNLSFRRIPQLFVYIFVESNNKIPHSILLLAIVSTFTFPWLLGLKIDWNNKAAITFFILTLSIVLLTPDFVFGTTLIYQRYAILFVTSYAILFKEKHNKLNNTFSLANASLVLVIISVWSVLIFHTQFNWKFKEETKVIDKMMSSLEPNQKVARIFSNNYKINSRKYSGDVPESVYENYVLWYQAEKLGFVETNFAGLAPFPVRYKPGADTDFTVTQFGLRLLDKSSFRYIIKRDNKVAINENYTELFKDDECKPVVINHIDKWTVYDNKKCMK
jgi:uncharacterized membrane protein